MSWIIQLLINAALLLLMAQIHPGVKVKSYGTAVAVAFVISFLNATIGAIIRFPLNLFTLFLLTFLVRLFVSAVVIWLTDKLFNGFELRSFGTAIVVACVLALAAGLISHY